MSYNTGLRFSLAVLCKKTACVAILCAMAVVASEKCRRNRLFVAYCFCTTQTYHIFQSMSIVILKNNKRYLTFVDFYSEKHSCFVNVRAIVDNVRM